MNFVPLKKKNVGLRAGKAALGGGGPRVGVPRLERPHAFLAPPGLVIHRGRFVEGEGRFDSECVVIVVVLR